MGPHRIIHNRRGYLTETVFDAGSGRFCERPFPPTVAQATSLRANDESISVLDQTDLHGLDRIFDGVAETR